VQLKDWSQRTSNGLSVQALTGRISQRFGSVQGMRPSRPVNPPPIRGLGTSSAFDFSSRTAAASPRQANAGAQTSCSRWRRRPGPRAVRANGQDDNPRSDQRRPREGGGVGVALTDVDQTFSIAWGSRFVNNFLDTDNRIKRVLRAGRCALPHEPGGPNLLYVRNTRGHGALSSFATGQWGLDRPSSSATRRGFDGDPGAGAAGRSTGQAMASMEALAKKLPAGIGYEWTGISLQQQLSGGQAPLLYALSILVVFLRLAALYESWSIPISVIMGGALRRARPRSPRRPPSTCRMTCTSWWACSDHRPVGEERHP